MFHKAMLALVSWSFLFWTAEGLVLDPALYLSPSPPLTATLKDPLWSQPRFAADLAVIPIEQIQTPEPTTDPTTTISATTSTDPEATSQEMMDKSDRLLQLLRTSKPSIGPYLGINVPLTFGLTGTYGGYGTGKLGVIGSSYGSVSDVVGNSGFSSLYGRSGLAGSSYGVYGGYGGTRLFGSGSGAAWSGWGNGKWGHYGKG